jgi:hypothetical protein
VVRRVASSFLSFLTFFAFKSNLTSSTSTLHLVIFVS